MIKWVIAAVSASLTFAAQADRQAAFTGQLEEIEAGLAAEPALMASGGGLGLVWAGDFLLYMPDQGRYTVDLIELASGDKERLFDHDELAARLPDDACELLGISANHENLRYLCADDIHVLDISRDQDKILKAAGIQVQRARPQVISDQFPTTFGPLVEAKSPDGSLFVTVKDHNLYLRSADDDSLRQLTRDGHLYETWLNTQESAQEFNTFWSADSRVIAAVQLDTHEVWHEPTPKLLENPPRTVPVAYPRAGEPIHQFRLFMIDAATGERTRIETGDTVNQYVDIIGWNGDDQGLFYQVLDREQKNKRIYIADRRDGSTKMLLEETTDTYHDSWMTIFINFVTPLSQSNGFLYLSERSGWRHIEYYDGDGELKTKVTSGQWAVAEIVQVDEQEGFVYFLAAMDGSEPYKQQLYRADLSGEGAPSLVSGGEGRVAARVSPDGRYFVTRYSSPEQPPRVELRRGSGELVTMLSVFDDSALVKAGYSGIETELVPDSEQRWQLPVTIMRPFGFDPGKKYPVIEHIYGGMQSVHTRHQYYGFGKGRVDDVTRMLLRSGYVVVRVDAPGTPERGKVFQDQAYGRWPQGVIAHHEAAIRAVAASRPWMDVNRLGIYGHSWGSYMAQRAMIEAPAFYLAAVAHNGGSDFYDQPTYIEPFMGLPSNNPEGYARASNLDRIDAVRGSILTFTAPYDVNSGFSPAFKLVDAMISARKDIELVVTPRSNHRMACCGDSETLFKLTKIRRFFDREVKAYIPEAER